MNLINLLDNYRFWNNRRNIILQKIKFYGIINWLVAGMANILLPIYFKATQHKSQYAISQNQKKRGERVIVSLTSYPVRIPDLWKVIETILHQTVKPDKIVLYLTKSQIGSIDKLPKSLLKLQSRGLEIQLLEEEIRSHTKYYGAFKQYPNDIVITIDDDLFYRTDLIENLLKWHQIYPNTIIANWVKEILPSTDKYKEWPDCSDSKLSNRFLLLGVSSVLYPPHCMYKDIFNVQMIKDLCLTADDVWLSCMALLQKTPIYFTGYKFGHIPVFIKNNTTLLSVNNNRNQIQIDNLNKYYHKLIGVRPFIDIE